MSLINFLLLIAFFFVLGVLIGMIFSSVKNQQKAECVNHLCPIRFAGQKCGCCERHEKLGPPRSE